MQWLADNWDSVLALINAFGLLVVGSSRKRGV